MPPYHMSWVNELISEKMNQYNFSTRHLLIILCDSQTKRRMVDKWKVWSRWNMLFLSSGWGGASYCWRRNRDRLKKLYILSPSKSSLCSNNPETAVSHKYGGLNLVPRAQSFPWLIFLLLKSAISSWQPSLFILFCLHLITVSSSYGKVCYKTNYFSLVILS